MFPVPHKQERYLCQALARVDTPLVSPFHSSFPSPCVTRTLHLLLHCHSRARDNTALKKRTPPQHLLPARGPPHCSTPLQHNSRPEAAVGSLHSPDDDDDEGLHCRPPITSLVDLVDIGVKLGIQLFGSGHLGPCPPPKASSPSPAAIPSGVAAHPSAAAATCNDKISSHRWSGCAYQD